MIGCVSDGECWRYKMMKKLEEEENSCRRMDRESVKMKLTNCTIF